MLRRLRPLILLSLAGWVVSRLPPETRQRVINLGKGLINDQLRRL